MVGEFYNITVAKGLVWKRDEHEWNAQILRMMRCEAIVLCFQPDVWAKSKAPPGATPFKRHALSRKKKKKKEAKTIRCRPL